MEKETLTTCAAALERQQSLFTQPQQVTYNENVNRAPLGSVVKTLDRNIPDLTVRRVFCCICLYLISYNRSTEASI